MDEEIQREARVEAHDIAKRTRVVPVLMIAGLLLTLGILAAFVVGIGEDTSDGSLRDDQGVYNRHTDQLLEEDAR
jgi:hypothetical protein